MSMRCPLPAVESATPLSFPPRRFGFVWVFCVLWVIFGVGCHGSAVKITADGAPTFDTVGQFLSDSPAVDFPSDGTTERERDGWNTDAPFDAAVENVVGVDTASAQSPDGRSTADASMSSETNVLITSATEVELAVWGSGPRDIWTGGKGGSLHPWDGTAWSDYPFFPSTCFAIAIWGSSSNKCAKRRLAGETCGTDLPCLEFYDCVNGACQLRACPA